MAELITATMLVMLYRRASWCWCWSWSVAAVGRGWRWSSPPLSPTTPYVHPVRRERLHGRCVLEPARVGSRAHHPRIAPALLALPRFHQTIARRQLPQLRVCQRVGQAVGAVIRHQAGPLLVPYHPGSARPKRCEGGLGVGRRDGCGREYRAGATTVLRVEVEKGVLGGCGGRGGRAG